MDQFRPREGQRPVQKIQRDMEDARDILSRFLRGRGIWITILILLALYLSSGFYNVQPGEKGVVLLFGKVYAVTDPGPRYHLPAPIMAHVIVDTSKVRREEIGYRTDNRGQIRSVPTESMMLTGDENIADVQLVVQYVVKDPVTFLYGSDNPVSILRVSAQVALRAVVGENTIDYTMTNGRTEVQNKVQARLQKLLDTYRTGLLVTRAQLLVVDSPSQVREAFHDVVRAWEDRQRLIREAEGYTADVLPKARGQAQQDILEAEAYKARRVIRAKGDADRFTSLLSEYAKAPKVTRERLYLEAAEHFLQSPKKYVIDSNGSHVLPLIPLAGREDIVSVTQPQPSAQLPPEKGIERK
jgi:modulator of FtsH protease HflK